MFFFVRRITNQHYWFRDIVELNNLWKSSNVNLNRGNNHFNWNKYSTQTELSLPGKNVKKYIQSISETYKNTTYKKNEELTSIVKIREVSCLLKHRCAVEESINNLVELGKQDEEMKKLGEEEFTEYCNTLKKIDEELLEVISDNLGRDQCCDVIFEITAGVGGQEAMLFAANLYRMYEGYFAHLGFIYNETEVSEDCEGGGLRHASLYVSGSRAFELLRHEGGVHRVQRNPATDKSGRIHTSTVSVIVIPQPTEIEINLSPKDLKIETKRSSAPGGQNVNKTESAVRVTHLPTGIAVEVQTQRSQIQNKTLALQKIRAKLYEMQLKDQKENTSSMKKVQRGMSQRNEKIRTYNFNQDRITDHRLTDGTMHNLKGFLDGGEELKNLQERLQKKFQLQLLNEAIEKCK